MLLFVVFLMLLLLLVAAIVKAVVQTMSTEATPTEMLESQELAALEWPPMGAQRESRRLLLRLR